MTRIMTIGVALAAGTFATCAVAQQPAAQAPASPPQQVTVNGTKASEKRTPDPNQVICEKQQDTSSRLVTKRVCMTRSQWAEQRRLDRQEIEKLQTERPMSN